jgi:hypothetical protein
MNNCKNESEIISKFLKFLQLEKFSIIYKEHFEIVKFIQDQNPEYFIENLRKDMKLVNNFFTLYFLILNICLPGNDKKIIMKFLKYANGLIVILFNKYPSKLNSHETFQNFIEKNIISESVVEYINDFLFNISFYMNEFYSELDLEEKHIYFVNFVNFILEYEVFLELLKIENIFEALKFFIEYLQREYKNSNLITISNLLIFKILSNLENLMNVKIEKIMINYINNERTKNYFYNHKSEKKYENNFDQESIKKILKHFQEKFYYGINDLETIISKFTYNNIHNILNSPNEVPNSNYFSREIFLIFSNSMQEGLGLFGTCTMCNKIADFYCITTRLPICSIVCKEKLIFKENFFAFMSIFKMNLKNINNNFIKRDNEIHSSEESYSYNNYDHISSLNFLKLNLEKILLYLIKFILNFKFSSTTESEVVNSSCKIQLTLEIILNILRNFNIIFDKQSFDKVVKQSSKLIFKIFLFGCSINKNKSILNLNIDLFYVLLKNFGFLYKSEFSLILDEIIKIIKLEITNIFSKNDKEGFLLKEKIMIEEKITFLCNFLEKIFEMHNRKFIFLLFLNFDNEVGKSNIIKETVETLILISSISSSYISQDIKIHTIKILIKILQIIDDKIKCLHPTEKHLISYINTYFETFPENKITKIKKNYISCREAFNINYKEISRIIVEKKINIKNQPIQNFLGNFLRYTEGLEKEKIGLFLGSKNEFNLEVFDHYLSNFNFRNLNIVDALRRFLFCFKISGESQVIDRIITKFSVKYFEDNEETEMKNYIYHSDSAYYLSFNIMILHTNIHNQNVSTKDKLTVETFIKTLNGLNYGKNFDPEFLKNIYENIKNFQFFNFERGEENSTDENLYYTNNFKMNLDLCEYSQWKSYVSNLSILIFSKIILQEIFQNLIIHLDTILNNFSQHNNENEKKYVYSFYDFFTTLLQMFENFNLNQEKISLLNIWIKIIDFKSINEINTNRLRSLKTFIKILFHKNYLFYGSWSPVFSFLINKHIFVQNIIIENSFTEKSESNLIVIKTLSRLFSKDKIEKLLSIAKKFDEGKFY